MYRIDFFYGSLNMIRLKYKNKNHYKIWFFHVIVTFLSFHIVFHRHIFYVDRANILLVWGIKKTIRPQWVHQNMQLLITS